MAYNVVMYKGCKWTKWSCNVIFHGKCVLKTKSWTPFKLNYYIQIYFYKDKYPLQNEHWKYVLMRKGIVFVFVKERTESLGPSLANRSGRVRRRGPPHFSCN